MLQCGATRHVPLCMSLQVCGCVCTAQVALVSDEEWAACSEATRAQLAALLDSSAAFYDTFKVGLGGWGGGLPEPNGIGGLRVALAVVLGDCACVVGGIR